MYVCRKKEFIWKFTLQIHEYIHIDDIHTRSALTAEVITECGPTTVNPVTKTKTAQQNINHYICMYVHMHARLLYVIITIICYYKMMHILKCCLLLKCASIQ